MPVGFGKLLAHTDKPGPQQSCESCPRCELYLCHHGLTELAPGLMQHGDEWRYLVFDLFAEACLGPWIQEAPEMAGKASRAGKANAST